MIDWLIETLRQNPVIPIFLTLGLGFWLGSLKFKSFSLGPVTATLIVGVIIGQLDIPIGTGIKNLSFMLFLFAIGYSVGPQFFRALRGEGLKQILFAFVECVICVATVIVLASLFGYSKGMGVGLYAGSQTVSAAIGMGADTLRSMNIPKDTLDKFIGIIPACYAVTYVFGTIGSAWIIANLGPILLGGLKKVKAETAKLEEEMDSGDFVPEPGMITANRPISFRAYRAESSFFNRPRTVEDIERLIAKKNLLHFVERLRLHGEIYDPEPDLRVRKGDIVVLSGHRESIIEQTDWIGPEVADHELLNFSTENLPVTVSKSGADGLTIAELREQPFMKGVMIRKVLRNDMPMPLRRRIKLQKGDVVTLVGTPEDVATAVPEIGYSDRATGKTDVVFISLAIAIGCLIGAIVVKVGDIPLSLSTSGGCILAGLVSGWFRSKRPTMGHIPRPVIWFMDNVGLNLFIAVVGLSAGPTFIEGLKEVGIGVFFAGIACTAIPLIICIYIGRYIFRFPAAVTLGCVAGSRNAVAAIGAIQDSLDSTLPMMGYTVTYAVGSVMMILAAMAVALIG